MTLSTVKNIILTSPDLDTIRQEKGSSSKTTEKETYPKSYAETIKGDRKIYKEDYRDTPPPRRFRFQNQQ
jgi:hypothetical protein